MKMVTGSVIMVTSEMGLENVEVILCDSSVALGGGVPHYKHREGRFLTRVNITHMEIYLIDTSCLLLSFLFELPYVLLIILIMDGRVTIYGCRC